MTIIASLDETPSMPTSMTLIEFVSRAIAKADDMPEEEWEHFEDLAIAGIKAVKEYVEMRQDGPK